MCSKVVVYEISMGEGGLKINNWLVNTKYTRLGLKDKVGTFLVLKWHVYS